MAVGPSICPNSLRRTRGIHGQRRQRAAFRVPRGEAPPESASSVSPSSLLPYRCPAGVEFEATASSPPPPPQMAEPDHFEFRVQPHDVRIGEWCRIEVAILDAWGNVVHWTERKCTSACGERETTTPRISARPVTGSCTRSTVLPSSIFTSVTREHAGSSQIRLSVPTARALWS